VIIAIPAKDVEYVFEKMNHLVSKFRTKYEGTSNEHVNNIKNFLSLGKGVLLVSFENNEIEACAILEPSELKDTIDITTVAGSNIKNWLGDMLQSILTVSKELKYKYVKTMPLSRKGWSKVLSKYNFVEENDYLIRRVQ